MAERPLAQLQMDGPPVVPPDFQFALNVFRENCPHVEPDATNGDGVSLVPSGVKGGVLSDVTVPWTGTVGPNAKVPPGGGGPAGSGPDKDFLMHCPDAAEASPVNLAQIRFDVGSNMKARALVDWAYEALSTARDFLRWIDIDLDDREPATVAWAAMEPGERFHANPLDFTSCRAWFGPFNNRALDRVREVVGLMRAALRQTGPEYVFNRIPWYACGGAVSDFTYAWPRLNPREIRICSDFWDDAVVSNKKRRLAFLQALAGVAQMQVWLGYSFPSEWPNHPDANVHIARGNTGVLRTDTFARWLLNRYEARGECFRPVGWEEQCTRVPWLRRDEIHDPRPENHGNWEIGAPPSPTTRGIGWTNLALQRLRDGWRNAYRWAETGRRFARRTALLDGPERLVMWNYANANIDELNRSYNGPAPARWFGQYQHWKLVWLFHVFDRVVKRFHCGMLRYPFFGNFTSASGPHPVKWWFEDHVFESATHFPPGNVLLRGNWYEEAGDASTRVILHEMMHYLLRDIANVPRDVRSDICTQDDNDRHCYTFDALDLAAANDNRVVRTIDCYTGWIRAYTNAWGFGWPAPPALAMCDGIPWVEHDKADWANDRVSDAARPFRSGCSTGFFYHWFNDWSTLP